MEKNSDSISVNEKDEVISRLYSLRAGLSVVAQERETADRLVDDAHGAKQRAIVNADARIKEEQDKIKKDNDEIKEIADAIEKQRRVANSAGFVPRLIVDTLILVVALACAGVFVLSFTCCIDVSLPVVGVLTEWIWEIPIGFVSTLICWAFMFVGFFGCGGLITLLACKWPFAGSLRDRKNARREIAEKESDLLKQKKKIADAEAALEAGHDRKKRDVADANANLAKAKKEATEHAMAGLAMIDALDDAYSDLVDVRDWENVDIIIYALETRRAENMKEALQVVDGERRTERIEAAVFDAGNAICQSINTGLRRLQGEMTRCFGILGQIVATQGEMIAAGLNGVNANIAANNKYLSDLTTQASMNNALLAKANENSRELADNVTQLRIAAEYSDARKAYRG